ncbi:transglutaminase family protein [Yoonia sp. BS5-3]|uniref:Transglutaminase family protein n=1 Tax=Yoonia phaeophyticola TaxID=3137369 RepID=A0ABZ2UZJ0_9RHOB
MKLQIRHSTTYDFEVPVTYALQKVRLRPQPTHLQDVIDWTLDVQGGRVETNYVDHYGNDVALVSIDPGAQSVVLTASGTVQTHESAGIFGKRYGVAPLWHFKQATEATEAGPLVVKLAAPLHDEADTLAALHHVSAAILAATPYEIGATEAGITAEQALETGAGVCQDHAQIFIAVCRAAGLPARYVSGYLMINGQIDQDATHAWAEAHVPDLGWVGFDVSNGVCPDEKYVRVAIGRDARDAAPVAGLRIGPGDEAMIVSVQVQQ